MEYQRLFRSRKDKVIAGVAGGLGEFFSVDPVLIRILFAVLAVFGGGGVLIYILLWIFVPYKEETNFYAGNQKSEPAPEPMQDEEKTEVYEYKFDKKENYTFRSRGSIFGAIVLITLGVLFLAGNFTSVNFEKLWPIILIVIGILLLFGNYKKKNTNDNI